MTDFEHWSKYHQDLWEQSSERETEITSQQGYKKSDVDFNVMRTNIFPEFKGLLMKSVGKDEAHYVSPDKVQNAKQDAAYKTWGVHHLPKSGLLRGVPLDAEFLTALDTGHFRIVKPRIRDVQRRYYENTAADRCVKPYIVLVERIKKA